VVDGEYVTDLEFTASSACRVGSLWRLPTDLNAGSGGPALHVCIQSDKTPPFLASISVVTGRSGRGTACPAGTNQSTDLNAGLDTGDSVYVCAIYSASGTAATLVKDIIPVIGAATACRTNYSRLAGDLNEGVLNAPSVFLCVWSRRQLRGSCAWRLPQLAAFTVVTAWLWLALQVKHSTGRPRLHSWHRRR
jgi:hypothetical protein